MVVNMLRVRIYLRVDVRLPHLTECDRKPLMNL